MPTVNKVQLVIPYKSFPWRKHFCVHGSLLAHGRMEKVHFPFAVNFSKCRAF
jgi:hypothetical protein